VPEPSWHAWLYPRFFIFASHDEHARTGSSPTTKTGNRHRNKATSAGPDQGPRGRMFRATNICRLVSANFGHAEIEERVEKHPALEHRSKHRRGRDAGSVVRESGRRTRAVLLV
jgi:hypothetical protein